MALRGARPPAAAAAAAAAPAAAAAAPNVPLPPSQAAALRAANDPNNIFSALTKRMGTLEINQTLINTWISLWEGQISAKLKNLSATQNATHTKLRAVQANLSSTQERTANPNPNPLTLTLTLTLTLALALTLTLALALPLALAQTLTTKLQDKVPARGQG